MPKALIIRGYCGTGKSTIAKYIAKTNSYAFLEYDTFLWNMNSTKNPTKFEYDITFKNFTCILKNYLKTKKDIMLEGPFVPRTEDDPFNIKKIIKILKKANYKITMIQLTAEDKICVERMKKRNHIVPKWERTIFKEKHELSIQNGETIIDTTNLTIKQTVNKINKILN